MFVIVAILIRLHYQISILKVFRNKTVRCYKRPLNVIEQYLLDHLGKITVVLLRFSRTLTYYTIWIVRPWELNSLVLDSSSLLCILSCVVLYVIHFHFSIAKHDISSLMSTVEFFYFFWCYMTSCMVSSDLIWGNLVRFKGKYLVQNR